MSDPAPPASMKGKIFRVGSWCGFTQAVRDFKRAWRSFSFPPDPARTATGWQSLSAAFRASLIAPRERQRQTRTVWASENRFAHGFRRGRTSFQNFLRNCLAILNGYTACRLPQVSSVSVTVNEGWPLKQPDHAHPHFHEAP
jgi:hypothetical protein